MPLLTQMHSRQAHSSISLSCCFCLCSLQGVQLHGYSQPLLQELDSMAAGRPSVVQLSSSSVLVHLLKLPG